MDAAVTPRAELSSIVTVVGDLVTRVGEIGEHARDTELDWLSGELFEAERSLREGHRRLSRAVARLRQGS